MVIVAVIVFLISIIIAHAFAPDGYSWKSGTVSRLANPGHPYSWILRLGMIAYGIILITATFDVTITSILIMVYGLGVIITGIFTVEKHKRLHLFSIYGAGAALVLAILRHAIMGDLVSILCLVTLITAELLFNMKALAKWRGLCQRIVHLSTFLWLVTFSPV